MSIVWHYIMYRMHIEIIKLRNKTAIRCLQVAAYTNLIGFFKGKIRKEKKINY